MPSQSSSSLSAISSSGSRTMPRLALLALALTMDNERPVSYGSIAICSPAASRWRKSVVMIHIIGTAHARTQFWSDAIKDGVSCDTNSATVEQFEEYLHDAAISLQATVLAEEMSQQVVDMRAGGVSVARQVAERLKLRHLYCDPDSDERQTLGITTADAREAIWMARITAAVSPNETSIIFVCGADHCGTFKAKLDQNGLLAQIHCADWMLN